MGYKDKKYQKDLIQQTNERLTSMLHAGEGTSKREAVKNGTDREKIFSYSTYESYFKHCKYFMRYVKKEHPEVTNLKQAKKYVNEWLQKRTDERDENGRGLSAWTINLERQALGKLYGIKPDDQNFFDAPKRHREEIFRSRVPSTMDKHFSVTNNAEFISFCRGTGCRRNIMEKLEGRDLATRQDIDRKIAELEAKSELDRYDAKQLAFCKDAVEQFPDQDYFVCHRNDKGGRDRYSPIVGKDKENIIERMSNTAPNEKVWLNVPGNADIHSYRGDYATAIYKMYARPIEEIPYDRVKKGSGIKYQSGVYVCRKDEKGKKLDKDAMLKASKALGHNRLEIVANNYIRGL
jgi:hypothetical protein